MVEIAGRNIIVTGASTGLGEMIARQIAKKGGNVILIARSEEKLRTLKEELEATYSISCTYYRVDLTDLQDWRATLTKIVEETGQIDALVNNAGFGIFDYVEEAKWEDAERMFQLNVFALIQGVYQVLPLFIEQNHGHIVNIGSQAGKIATPKSSIYSATKHAVIGFSNALRLEVADKGVFVTTVNLGPVRTNFFDVADPTGHYQKSVDRFMLNPEQVAQKIVNGLFTNKREINLPGWMNAGSKFYQLFPSMMERILKKQFNKK